MIFPRFLLVTALVVPFALWAQTWSYTPPAYPEMCTNPAEPGQWTMDYETASARALAENRNLYLLITGSTWCPDCDGLQRQVMETGGLQAFMRTSDAYWVWLDLPPRSMTNATQYGWLCHPNTGLFTLQESERILARNRQLEYIYGSIKAYRSPGTINMPTVVVCRPDGAYQGEVTHYRQWKNVGAEEFIGKIHRIWNDDAWDVQDNLVPGKDDDSAPVATALMDISRTAKSQPHTLSPTDGADWFVLPAQPGGTYAFSAGGRLLDGQTSWPSGRIAVDVYLETNAAALPVASVSGVLSKKQEVVWTLAGTTPQKAYVRVSGRFNAVVGYAFTYNQMNAVPPPARSVKRAEGALIDENGTLRVAGLLTLSVTKGGRMTAKYRTMEQTIAFSAKEFWASYDESGQILCETSQGAFKLVVWMPGADEIYASVTDPAYPEALAGVLIEAATGRGEWADSYAGYYTVALEPEVVVGQAASSGYSYLTVLVKASAGRNGRVTYAGRLADGQSCSGSALFHPFGDCTAYMTVFRRKGQHRLAGILSICANAEQARWDDPSVVSAADGVQMSWACVTGDEETSYDVTLGVSGGYYSPADSLLDYYGMYPGDGPMYLMAGGAVPVSSVYGTAKDLPMQPMAISDTVLAPAQDAGAPARLRFSLNKKTGVYNGSFKLIFERSGGVTQTVPVKYAGVLLPGWVGEGGCDTGCGPVVGSLPVKPFGMGSYWFNDRVPVEVGGRARTVRRSVGYPFIIDKIAE